MKNIVKKAIRFFLIAAFLLPFSLAAVANEATQTIRGVVRDQESRMALIGANVVVVNSNPLIGASTDLNGKFTLEKVPLGRIDLKVSYLGYEDKFINNLIITAGKQVVLEIDLVEAIGKLGEIVVEAQQKRTEAINEMAVLSAHTFSVEETQRYAGSFSDPARMVSAFAGVTGGGSENNDIVVRGNSPKGILWRLEGVEIPAPNHFGNEGETGGPVNTLNSNMLANSDFFTGAFSPEYGNASSGVFDMKLRTGNNQKREYSIGIGAIGIDATVEGPFSQNGNASYLANYRYSSLAILEDLGIINFKGVPKYQDGSFKIHLPTSKAGTFSVFGLGGMSNIRMEDKDKENKEIIYSVGDYTANMGVAGINQVLPLNEKSFLRNSFSIATNGNGGVFTDFEDAASNILQDEKLQRTSYRLSSIYNTKLNSRHTFKTGFIYSNNHFDFIGKYFNHRSQKLETLFEEKGTADLAQGFTTWKWRINEDLTFIGGLHYMHFLLNNSNSVEPRAGLNYKLNEKNTINLGYGKHSKLEPLTVYFANTYDAEGNLSNGNRNLGLSKAHHFVLGYKHILNQNLVLSSELYYQQLYNIPVENNLQGTFSMINSHGWITNKELINSGKGRNYGAEITLEKYLSQGFFFLITTSLYQSEYKNLNNTWRNTQFNGNFVGNALFGKEISIGKPSSHKTLGISGRITYAGGTRYTPINLEESRKRGYGVRDEQAAFSARADDLFLANMVVYYRKDRKKTTHEIRMDVQNITGHSARLNEFYNSRTGKIQYMRQLPLIPVIFYKVDF